MRYNTIHQPDVGGEIQEVVRSNDPSVSESDYLEIIEKKTAAIIEACCHIGAILGNVSEPLEQALVTYGRLVGTAFQLADDVLDYSANEAKLGKKTGQICVREN
jgi:octaprenyl-diphosphate synthase